MNLESMVEKITVMQHNLENPVIKGDADVRNVVLKKYNEYLHALLSHYALPEYRQARRWLTEYEHTLPVERI